MVDISVILMALLVYVWIFLPDFDYVNIVSYIFDNVEFNSGKTIPLKIVRKPQYTDFAYQTVCDIV